MMSLQFECQANVRIWCQVPQKVTSSYYGDVKIIQNNNWKVHKSIRLIQNDLSYWIISNNRGKANDLSCKKMLGPLYDNVKNVSANWGKKWKLIYSKTTLVSEAGCHYTNFPEFCSNSRILRPSLSNYIYHTIDSVVGQESFCTGRVFGVRV